MAYFNHWRSETDNTFNGRLSFNTNSSAGNTTVACQQLQWDYYPQPASETATADSLLTGPVMNETYTRTTATTNTWSTSWDFHDVVQGSWAQPSFRFTGGFSEVGKLKNALMKIFEKVPKDLIKTKEDKRLVRAKEKSEKLLKDWMTPAEYKALKEKGEIEIPSQIDDDVIFIVKRDPNAMVDVKKNGKKTHKLCAVAEDLDYAVGDQLLSKIALIKTDEKKFKEIAVKHGTYG